jgi:cytochrome b6-f complex iron-sulfur subunit
MKINRREFLLLTAGVVVAGCKTADNSGNPAASAEKTINAGLVGNFAADGVYGNFRDEGFFVIRKGGKLFALSAICTHRNCKLTAEPDKSFYCKCHGSTFAPDGKVTEGPARRDLPVLPTFTNESGELLVKIPAA